MEKGEVLSAECAGIIRCLRDAYNALLSEMEGDGDADYGDSEIFANFKRVLHELPRKEPVGRPFSKVRKDDVRRGETMRGGMGQFHRKD